MCMYHRSGLLSEYKSLYSPTVSPLSAPVLRFQLRKFLRRAKTELSCLTGTGRLDLLLSQLGLVLGDQIDSRGPGEVELVTVVVIGLYDV